MIRFANTVTINRTPATVFAYLADFENLPRWNYAIIATRKLDRGPVTVGTRYAQTRTSPTRREETFEVIEFEPERRLTIRGTFGPFPGELAYQLDTAGSVASTLLTNAVLLDTPRLLGATAPLATRQIKSAVAANLSMLKRVLEQTPS